MTKFEVPKEISDKVLQTLELAKNTGKIRKGTNETTKSIERGEAKLVVIAGDVQPPEITMHLPVLCKEKKIPYVHVPSKEELGRSTGINVGTAAATIVESGEGKSNLEEILKKLQDLKKGD
ncbi:MAG: 50S ribosomal protein L7ae [Candidatus Aenigmarchaeota archaeon CG_4_10_14_0_8_um_filter_37_24]|nr:50S ribosomal protein L7ae [Candidatus Aenigmarchaeota archaeon]OIN88658.1 MAG: 50S ribosomal protein L7ae [Candidatus Aenigmarchaeota archaeon CG1_02_38_14]PIV68442.1 MAG: 50S ribosomal protein L7ae [Candidatus Aenigmarchaeota archaeon CG01_land_8_20_14_3_00_37_9]PIW40785.1 MAG: 50S ribosomal protein L7ae [Candidatus Aenigmarchaeota archaeon CG15_BIG_FIL_POST_REV_8_21_14_020_37_27]PIX50613.1 MAG: 50S ribosomal protein L7ae [Candidatus Aenigmarchaeota archaeon CG_4_8_14_3_um_filter_37_24]PI